MEAELTDSSLTRAEWIMRLHEGAHLPELGQVVCQWSTMEAMLEACIWRVAGVRNDIGRVICAQLQVQSKLDLLSALLNQNKPTLAKQFEAVAAYVRDCLIGKRNLMIHGAWVFPQRAAGVVDNEVPQIIKFAAKGKLVDQSSTMEINEVKALAKAIAEVTQWLLDFAQLLPKLRQRPGGLGLPIPGPQSRRDCAILKQQALQPPTRRPKAPKPQPQKQKKKRRPVAA